MLIVTHLAIDHRYLLNLMDNKGTSIEEQLIPLPPRTVVKFNKLPSGQIESSNPLGQQIWFPELLNRNNFTPIPTMT